MDCPVDDCERPAVQRHAADGELPQIDVAAAVAPRDVVVGGLPLGEAARRDRHVVQAHLGEPGHAVPAPVEPGDTGCPAHGEVHVAALDVQVLGDLGARLPGADDEHRPLRQLARVAVLVRVHMRDRRGDVLRPVGHHGLVVPTGGGGDGVGGDHPGRGDDGEAALRPLLDPDDLDALRDGSVEGVGIRPHPGVDLVARHEPVGVRAVVRVSREPAVPVRRDEREGVPPAVAPLVGDLVTLDDEVPDVPLDEVVAEREAGLPASHDDGVEVVTCDDWGRDHDPVLSSCGSMVSTSTSAVGWMSAG